MIAVIACSFVAAPALAQPAAKMQFVDGRPGSIEALLAKLEKRIDIDFEKKPLIEVAQSLAKEAGVPLIVERKALKDVGVDPNEPVTLHFRQMRVRSALAHLLKPHDLAWTVRNEALVVTAYDEIDQILRFYAVDDLVLGDESIGFYDLDPLIDLITSTCAPTTWDTVGGPGQIDHICNTLYFNQSLEVHEEAAYLLQVLRAAKEKSDKWDRRERPADLRPLRTWPPVEPIEAAWEKARRQRISLKFEKTPLAEVAKSLRERTGLPITFDAKNLADDFIDLKSPITFSCQDSPLEEALLSLLAGSRKEREELRDQIAGPSELGIRLWEESVQVTTEWELDASLETWVFPVFDLVEDHLPDPDQLGGEVPAHLPNYSSGETLAHLIAGSVRPKSWDLQGGPGSVVYFEASRALVVSQRREVIGEVEAFLSKLRKSLPLAKKIGGKDRDALITREYPATLAPVITTFIQPESWTALGSKAKIAVVGKRAIVTHTRRVHDTIRNTLIWGFNAEKIDNAAPAGPPGGFPPNSRAQLPQIFPKPATRGERLSPEEIFAALEKRGDFEASEMPWKETIAELGKRAGLPISIHEKNLGDNFTFPRVTWKWKGVRFRSMLAHLLADAGLAFSIHDGRLWIDTHRGAADDLYPQIYPARGILAEALAGPDGSDLPGFFSAQRHPIGEAGVYPVLGAPVVLQSAKVQEELVPLLAGLEKCRASAKKWKGKDRQLPDLPTDRAWRGLQPADPRWEAARRRPISLDFRRTPLAEVVEFLAQKTSLPFQLDRWELGTKGIEPTEPVTFACENLPLESALAHLWRTHSLRCVPWYETYLVTTPDRERACLDTWVIPVYDLLGAPHLTDAFQPNHLALDSDTLIDLITSTIGPTEWDSVGGPGSIDYYEPAGALIVTMPVNRLPEVVAVLEMVRSIAPLPPWPDPNQPDTAMVTRIYQLGGGLIDGKPKLTVTLAEAADLVRARIEPESWAKADLGAKLVVTDDRLIVRHRRDIHARIRRYLPSLLHKEQYMGGMGGGFFQMREAKP